MSRLCERCNKNTTNKVMKQGIEYHCWSCGYKKYLSSGFDKEPVWCDGSMKIKFRDDIFTLFMILLFLFFVVLGIIHLVKWFI